MNLRLHGDADVLGDGADLSVNVVSPTPAWLLDHLRAALEDLSAYPDATRARETLARHLGVPAEAVLLTAGGAEAFTLLARLADWRAPVVIHPQFTEPEAALIAAGHAPMRVVGRAEDHFALHPAAVPESADLVCVGNPTNPTARLHPREDILALRRPGCLVLVDEAFMDATDESHSVLRAAAQDEGVAVVRSLTKTFGIAGLRAGFVVAAPAAIARLAELQPPWSVGTLALAAVEATCTPAAREHVLAWRGAISLAREQLTGLLRDRGFRVIGPAEAPFVLAQRRDAGELRERLRGLGIAVRRGDTFPGLDSGWVRIAVRDKVTHDRLAAAIDHLDTTPSPSKENL